MSSDLFKYVNNILEHKIYDKEIPDYYPFIVNKALSFHIDTTWYANDMNMHAHLSNRMQYDFFYHCVRPMKRRTRWVNASKKGLADLDLIKEYFNYNSQRAKEALSILSKDQIETIRTKMQTGGTNDR